MVGQKVGMTRVFDDQGVSTPVTVVLVQANRITQIKTEETDGYSALQVTVGTRRPGRVSAPQKGHFARAGTEPGRGLWEFAVDADTASRYEPGTAVSLDLFEAGQKVDVSGTTIGRGFAGVMRRYGFGGGRATHGNSKAHRKPGSIGQNQDPGRVFKGKKMAGHMGDHRVTVRNVEVVQSDPDRNLLLVKGSVPGARNSLVLVQKSKKIVRS